MPVIVAGPIMAEMTIKPIENSWGGLSIALLCADQVC
jgi:hypothetical protein